MVGATQRICDCPLIAILVSNAIAKKIAFKIFIITVFRVKNMYKKKLSNVSEIIPSTTAKVISPECQRNIANGNMLIEPSKLRDSNTFSDTSLFIIPFPVSFQY